LITVRYTNTLTCLLTYIHMLRTDPALTDLVSQQPINTKYSCDADARGYERVVTCNWVDLFRSVQFSSCAVNAH